MDDSETAKIYGTQVLSTGEVLKAFLSQQFGANSR